MENLYEHIDRIILEKEYTQLSADELAQIQEFITNEEEYNDFRHTLKAVREQFAQEIEVEPMDEIRDSLLAQFESYQKTVHSKPTSSGRSYFFPSEKQFFAKPGVQVMMAAAAIALLIGFVFNFSLDIDRKEVAMDTHASKDESVPAPAAEAYLEEEAVTEAEHPTSSTEDKNSDSKNVELIDEYSKTDAIIHTKSAVTKPAEYPSPSVYNENEKSDEILMKSNSPSSTIVSTGTSEMTDEVSSAASYDNFLSMEESAVRQANTKNSTDKKRSITAEQTVTTSSSDQLKSPKKSKSLSENADLIAYFYTTM
jgi:hypothetical protein